MSLSGNVVDLLPSTSSAGRKVCMKPTEMPVTSTGVLLALVTSMCRMLPSASGGNLLQTLTVNCVRASNGNEMCIGDTRLVSILVLPSTLS